MQAILLHCLDLRQARRYCPRCCETGLTKGLDRILYLTKLNRNDLDSTADIVTTHMWLGPREDVKTRGLDPASLSFPSLSLLKPLSRLPHLQREESPKPAQAPRTPSLWEGWLLPSISSSSLATRLLIFFPRSWTSTDLSHGARISRPFSKSLSTVSMRPFRPRHPLVSNADFHLLFLSPNWPRQSRREPAKANMSLL